MSNAAGNGTASRPDSGVESFSALIARVLSAENTDLHRCMAADMNAFLMGLSLLSNRKEVGPQDVPLLFERFRLTLQSLPPSTRGPSEFAPRSHQPSRLAAGQDQG